MRRGDDMVNLRWAVVVSIDEDDLRGLSTHVSLLLLHVLSRSIDSHNFASLSAAKSKPNGFPLPFVCPLFTIPSFSVLPLYGNYSIDRHQMDPNADAACQRWRQKLTMRRLAPMGGGFEQRRLQKQRDG